MHSLDQGKQEQFELGCWRMPYYFDPFLVEKDCEYAEYKW